MAKEDLTAQQLRDVLQYNEESGVFTWAKGKYRNRPAGGSRSDGYHRITIGNDTYLTHRLAWLFVYGCWPKHCIDHRDGNPTNNAISNLRDVPQTVNAQNQWRARSNNECGLLGASWSKQHNAWVTGIRVGGNRKFIGAFKTAEDAHKAYIENKIKLHGFP